MKKEFWLERWEREEIGFHEGEPNAYLKQFWRKLNIAQGEKIFVPMCGKSADMQWLRTQGYPIVGVELSSIAVKDFFREQGYVPRLHEQKKFKAFDANDIQILCGNFFDLSRDDLVGVKAVFDRASMVALPLEMREQYIRHLVDILSPGVKILLVAFDYPQQDMQGPPFAVSKVEIETLYRNYADVSLLEKIDVLQANPRFQQRGVARLEESVYLLTLKQGENR